MISITLSTFAVLKDLFGNTITINVKEPFTVANIFESLKDKHPDKQHIWERCRIACNNKFVTSDHTISEADQLSIMPPSSGG